MANVLLKGLALPVDMSTLHADSLDDNFLELHSNLVKVSLVSVLCFFEVFALGIYRSFFHASEPGFDCHPYEGSGVSKGDQDR